MELESRLPDFILYCETMGHQDNVVLEQKQRNVWNRIISPEINTCTYFHLIPMANEARIYNGIKTVSSLIGASLKKKKKKKEDSNK